MLDRHGAINGLFLIRRSTHSEDCFTLDICFQREKHHYKITHFVSCSLCVNMSLIRYPTVNIVTATTLFSSSVVAVTVLTVEYLIRDIFRLFLFS